MANYRASFSRTLEGSLVDKPDNEANIDRLTAFSLASNELGSAWWRLAYDLDSSAYDPALKALQALTNVQKALCELVLHEALDPHCKFCRGAKELVLTNDTGGLVRKVCTHCKGTGIHRFSDKERSKWLKWSMASVRRHSKQIQKVYDTLQTADRRVSAGMHERLID